MHTADPLVVRPTAQLLEEHRPALTAHCYRMLGSVAEAEDAVQESILRAWRAADGFEGRASVDTWLHRIATRVCLDLLADRTRRGRPVELGAVGTIDDVLTALPSSNWIEPIPDALVLAPDAGPERVFATRQSIRLAFIAALHHLPPRQRAALLLTEVLGWSAAETADCLGMTVAAVNSALQRARATLAAREVVGDQEVLTEVQESLVLRFVEAFERYDVEALTRLLHEEATLSMPPYSLWLRGHEAIAGWLLGRGADCRGSRLLPTAASGSPAFGQYRPGATPGAPHRPWSLVVLEFRGDRISALNHFLDTEVLFPRFGLPPELPASLVVR
jgi:RNA polymerase sigma-70 factor (ECF subfamily)